MQQINVLALWRELGPAYLRELSTFGAMSDRVLLNLLTGGRVLQLSRDEVLYKLGERTESFYIVLQGSINNYVPGQEGGRIRSSSLLCPCPGFGRCCCSQT